MSITSHPAIMSAKCRMMIGSMLLAGSLTVRAETYYVATNGVDTRTGTGDWANALATISNALAKATAAHDLVLASNGTYKLDAQITIVNPVTVRGWKGPEFTVIDGNYPTRLSRSIWIDHPDAILAGFTISNSAAWQGSGSENSNGGAVWLERGTVSNCHIVNNLSERYGGGIYVAGDGRVINCAVKYCSAFSEGGGIALHGVSGAIIDSTVFSNSAAKGGGLSVGTSFVSNCLIISNYTTEVGKDSCGGGIYLIGAATVTDCTIQDNITEGYGGGGGWGNGAGARWERCLIQGNRSEYSSFGGGGLHLHADQQVTDCLIISNYSQYQGGGVYIYRSNTELRNCTIVANTAIAQPIGGGGLYVNRRNDGMHTNNFINMLVYFNEAAGGVYSNYYCQCYLPDTISFLNCCFAPAPPAGYHSNTITVDPDLVNWPEGDYRLNGASLCINAGLTLSEMLGGYDVEGRRRVDMFSRIVDIGAYEYVPRGGVWVIR